MKRIAGALFLSVFCVLLFAQSAPKKILTKKILDSFIQNYDAIDEIIRDNERTFALVLEQAMSNPSRDISSIVATQNISKETQNALKKQGLGDNGFEKTFAISVGFTALTLDMLLTEQYAYYDQFPPDYQLYLDDTNTQIQTMKKMLNSEDLSLIFSRYDELAELFEFSEEEM
ncbi:hypothetical protein K7I13_07380 [Brucepastera parasyntrophica]|uniref:hypothetical protein n=1 Tax=Brucepastera parasyntrophica TaxID=2880008 RepID=UPI00210CFD3B|nr:hypothetical protein [Brucepastera parasyntrophica]ULQ61065.1 hypothetical protein K7I13_07380 [Brucepastera parasyntrophica]